MVVVAQEIAHDALARLGRALADETRRRILLSLVEGPAYPSGLVAAHGLSKANVSNHLACLRECGLVVAEPEGRRVRYELADQRLGEALALVASVMVAVAERCADQ